MSLASMRVAAAVRSYVSAYGLPGAPVSASQLGRYARISRSSFCRHARETCPLEVETEEGIVTISVADQRRGYLIEPVGVVA